MLGDAAECSAVLGTLRSSAEGPCEPLDTNGGGMEAGRGSSNGVGTFSVSVVSHGYAVLVTDRPADRQAAKALRETNRASRIYRLVKTSIDRIRRLTLQLRNSIC